MKTRLALSVLLLITAISQAFAVGALFVRPLRSNAEHRAIAITSYTANVEIHDHVATTHVDQVFHNELNDVVEATLVFPLPPGAVITEMYYHFNGVKYKASVRERKEAQAAYDGKIRRLLDPALLTDLGDNIFKLQIAPVNGVSDVRVEITYTEIMPFVLGKSVYTHLLRTTGLSPKPLTNMLLTINAHTQRSWSSITAPGYPESPAHQIVYETAQHVRVQLGDESYVPSRNYVLELASKRDGVEISTLTYVPMPSDSFGTKPFYLTWVIPPDTSSTAVPRDIAFVADVSSSMNPQRMDQLREAMLYFLSQLTNDDRFNVLTFSTNVMAFEQDFVAATRDNLDRAAAFVQRMQALGLTNMSAALRTALTMDYLPNRAHAIVFITDGVPSFGELNETRIRDSVAAWNTHDVGIYPITIGQETSVDLMRKLAQRSGGFHTEIMADDSIALTVQHALKRLSMPNVSNITLDYGNLITYDVEPRILPDVNVGGRIIQSGRYEQGGWYPVSMTAKILGVDVAHTEQVLFGSPENNNKAVARLWARARIDALYEEIERLGEVQELVDAIIALSLQFEILTTYTALYADPDDPGATSVDNTSNSGRVALAVAPNPAASDESIRVMLPASMSGDPTTAPVTIRIVDLTGRIVAQLTATPVQGQITLPLHPYTLTTGMYLLVVQSEQHTYTTYLSITEGAQP